MVIRAHYDGKVFIPDEPVDIPTNEPLRLLIVAPSDGDRPLMRLIEAAKAAPATEPWPADGAAELDHYLYDTPKRTG